MAAEPSVASTLGKDEPTIRFATEAGVYNLPSSKIAAGLQNNQFDQNLT